MSHSGLPTVISPAHDHLAETGSDKLPSFPWDLGVHLVSRMCSLHDDPGGAREPHTQPWVGLEWAGRYLSYRERPFLPLDHRDRASRCFG